MPANRISLDNAKKDKLFYFVSNVIIYRNDGRCLILKRSDFEKVHPGKYCVPGGKFEWSMLPVNKPTRINGDVLDYENAVEALLRREVMEEASIEIEEKLYYINSVAFIRPDGIPVVMLKFAAKYKSGNVVISKDFTDYRWVDKKEVLAFDCIKGVPEEIRKTIDLFTKNK
ncbi:MAG: NUDIX domain-containing protein [Candidatus Aenigmarchaeota archaeon]|nr:NUDIX domain-containing protein [Candidatus Aenigmarchaeota archaeon]